MKTATSQQKEKQEHSYQIISEMIPPSRVVLKDMEKLIRILYSAFDETNSEVLEYLRSQKDVDQKKKLDKWFQSPFMRYLVHRYLHDEGIKTLLEEDNDDELVPEWSQAILSNNGLSGTFSGYTHRILKAVNGKLPPPGPSERKKAYYRQSHMQQAYLIPPDYLDDNKPHPNIVFLWELDNKNAIQLYLSIPKSGDEKQAFDYYTVPIEHPVTTYKPEAMEQDKEESSEMIDITVKDSINVARED